MTIKKDLKDANYDGLSKTELIKQIRQGLQEAKEGKTETLENLEKILDES